ncbi:MAG: ChaN family lipoprotein [Crocinitomicaceae bacterium]
MKLLITLTLLITSAYSYSQNREAFVIYNAKGKKVSYKKMLKAMTEKDIVLFGESHDNPISHWLELEITKDLDQENDLVLGAEMYEADNQLQINDYVSGKIDYKALDTLARLWSNDQTDYLPLLDYAKANNLKFIATNIPRRYASMVYKKGFEALDELSDQEKAWMAPLPMPYDASLPRYVNILEMMGDHGSPKLVMAQATKDATMAHFILNNWSIGKQFIHYNGSYHSDYYEGILWYLQRERPSLNYGTISTVSQADITHLEDEYLGKADFIICVDEDMTTTY